MQSGVRLSGAGQMNAVINFARCPAMLPGGQDLRPIVRVRTQAPDRQSLQARELEKMLNMASSTVDPALRRPLRQPSTFNRPAPPADSRSKNSSWQQQLGLQAAPTPCADQTGSLHSSQASQALPRPVLSPTEDYHPSDGWRLRPHHLSQEQLWERIREEASLDAIYAADPEILASGVADLQAVLDRDPACAKYSQCMLQFKGFQAIQSYRITHWLWNQGRQSLALSIQSRISELFSVDIHPAAILGRGVMFDHATGIVIGETAIVGDNVSMLHHVSLGGSGTNRCARHPHIGHGVLLGAGAAILGPVTVGAGSKVGAGSVVVSDLPDHCVAVGVPATIMKRSLRAEPVREMDQCTDFILDYTI